MDNSFSVNIRVLLCQNCHGPLKVSMEGGYFDCEYCGTTNEIIPKSNVEGETPTAGSAKVTADDSAADKERERRRLLKRQADTYFIHGKSSRYSMISVPKDLKPLVHVALSDYEKPAVLNRIRAEYDRLLPRLQSNAGDKTARDDLEHRCFWLSQALSNIYTFQKNYLLTRAVLEATLEAVQDPGFNYFIFADLALSALNVNNGEAAGDWLTKWFWGATGQSSSAAESTACA